MAGYEDYFAGDEDYFAGDRIEIFGDDGEFGADYADLVAGDEEEFGALEIGAVRRPMVRRVVPARPMVRRPQGRVVQPARPALPQGAYRPVGGGPVIQETSPRRQRQLPLGVDSGAVNIAAGASQDISILPQVPFRLQRLVVAAAIAGSFSIRDIRVGKDSQLVASGEIPAEVFSNVSQGTDLKGDTASPGIQIVVSVTNTSTAAARFRGALIGFTLV